MPVLFQGFPSLKYALMGIAPPLLQLELIHIVRIEGLFVSH